VYTDSGNIYNLTVNFEGALRNLHWNIIKIKEKWDFKSIFSTFIGEVVDNAFILNPFSYSLYEKNRNNNHVFILNDNVLKKLNITIKETIDIEVNFYNI
jgi:hypothetical protein